MRNTTFIHFQDITLHHTLLLERPIVIIYIYIYICISMSKETIALFWDCVSNTRKLKAKVAGKYLWKRNLKSFSNETNFFFRKFWASYILDLAKTVRALRILSKKSTRNFGIKELWALENHVLVNMLLCSSHFTDVHYVYIDT